MEVHFTPEQEAQLAQLATKAATDAERLELLILIFSLLLPGFPSAVQNRLQVSLETLQRGNFLWGGLQDFLLVDEDFLSIPLHQWPQTLAHAPADIAQDLEAIDSRRQKSQTAIPQDTNGFGKAFKGLEIKAGNVELLELLGRIGHEVRL